MLDRVNVLRERRFATVLVRVWKDYYIIIIFVIMVIVSALASPVFFSIINITNILRQSAVPGIVALGMLLVILTGGIDLSVGSVVAITGVLAVGLQRQMPLVIAVGLAVVVGFATGLINGVFITKRDVPPFVATLGMMAIARGLTYIYTHGGPISITYPGFYFLGRGGVGPIPFIVIMWILLSAIVAAVLARITFGRTIMAIGSNTKAVYLSGINVSRHIMAVYALSGLLCGIGGVLLASRLTIGTPLMGVSMELEAIAAVVIGGASLAGGRGTVWGTIMGVLILGLLSNMLNLVGVSMFYQDVVRGAIIIIAVLFKGFERR